MATRRLLAAWIALDTNLEDLLVAPRVPCIVQHDLRSNRITCCRCLPLFLVSTYHHLSRRRNKGSSPARISWWNCCIRTIFLTLTLELYVKSKSILSHPNSIKLRQGCCRTISWKKSLFLELWEPGTGTLYYFLCLYFLKKPITHNPFCRTTLERLSTTSDERREATHHHHLSPLIKP
jgi:hypothetical protein